MDTNDWTSWLDGPLDWDGDDTSCPLGSLSAQDHVLDTDPDPRYFEPYDPSVPTQGPDADWQGTFQHYHEWCDATQSPTPTDQGSPHSFH